MERKLVLYIAMSIDGYIAKPNDDLSFLEMVQEEGEDYGYTSFIQTIDTVIMGRKTYDWVLKQVGEFPHADKEAYIITRTPKPAIGKTQFYSGSLKALVAGLKQQPGKNIYCDGGAEIVNELLQEQLIDELIISVIPIILGEGTPLFRKGCPEQEFTLSSAKSFNKGLVQLHYQKLK